MLLLLLVEQALLAAVSLASLYCLSNGLIWLLLQAILTIASANHV
jgi:hypothetical protein